MEKQLHWIKEAFSRDVVIMAGEQVIGGMHRDLLAWDVDAYLNDAAILFDVKGFLVHSVNVHDKKDNNRIIGQIDFDWLHSATLTLATGETYVWKRDNFLMWDWSILEADGEGTGDEIIHYDRTQALIVDEGHIELLKESPYTEILILTGLFVRNYFLRKRKLAAAH